MRPPWYIGAVPWNLLAALLVFLALWAAAGLSLRWAGMEPRRALALGLLAACVLSLLLLIALTLLMILVVVVFVGFLAVAGSDPSAW